MKEKISAFFHNEKLKIFVKKVFNKKTIIGAIIAIVLVIALKVAFSLMFKVEGTVKNVEGSKITVANFLTTKTVDIGNLQTAYGNIKVGDRIEIMKNLSGDVISVKDHNLQRINGKSNGKHKFKGKGEKNFKGNEGHNSNREK